MTQQENPKKSDSQPNQDKQTKKNPLHIDWFQFAIALIIIVSFTMFVGKVVWANPSFEDSFKIISIVAPFVGTIIGFYFGQKPVQNLTNEVAKITSEKNTVKNEAGSVFSKTDSIQTEVDTVKKEIDNIKSMMRGL